MSWTTLLSRARSTGVDPRLLLNSIIACRWSYPVPGFPHVPATLALSWPALSPITYGTALSSTQLGAKANMSGTFAYSPSAGAILTAGSQTLTVTFVPSDTRFQSRTITTTLVVMKANPTLTVSSRFVTYNAAAQAVDVTLRGVLGEVVGAHS